MSKYYFQFSESSYKILQKDLGKYSVDIEGIPVKNFLIANTMVDDPANPLHIRIRNIILHIAGDFDTRPEDLIDEVNLEFSLKYRNTEYLLLQKQLGQLLISLDKNLFVSLKEVQACLTVADCVALVKAKLGEK